MATGPRGEGDARPGPAGEHVGQAAHAIDGRLRVAGGDNELHGLDTPLSGVALRLSGSRLSALYAR
jgi:hypothetical protein